MMAKMVYKSRIDCWVWLVFLFMAGVTAAIAIDTTWWVALSFGGTMLICAFLIVGCWYEIDGDQLVVYQFFRPNHFPIDKIAEMKKTTGILATAGMSCRRVSIKFTDRSVMKSAMPLEISPKDRDRFMVKLKEINPAIVIKE